jgi:hypothetical protein
VDGEEYITTIPLTASVSLGSFSLFFLQPVKEISELMPWLIRLFSTG